MFTNPEGVTFYITPSGFHAGARCSIHNNFSPSGLSPLRVVRPQLDIAYAQLGENHLARIV